MAAARCFAGTASRGMGRHAEGGGGLRAVRRSRCARGLWPRMAGACCPRDGGGSAPASYSGELVLVLGSEREDGDGSGGFLTLWRTSRWSPCRPGRSERGIDGGGSKLDFGGYGGRALGH